ncbi:MAG: exo-alpha-sialidase [Pirellulales bacterium]|nr:exo-alpha-sialidase [Pirellulales bacterium]
MKARWLVALFLVATITCILNPSSMVAVPQLDRAGTPVVKVILAEEQTRHLDYRRTLVGPGINQPDPFPGYGGFVGWCAPVRTRTGALIVTFSAGYWHASLPTPTTEVPLSDIQTWRKIGMPEINAPTGGRALMVRSEDSGLTWSRPQLMIDTVKDEVCPAATLLADGTLLASFYVQYLADRGWKIGTIRSFDDGKTWEQTPRYVAEPFEKTYTDGPPLEMPDKSVLIVASVGTKTEAEPRPLAIFRSPDRGANWSHVATIPAPFHQDEPSITRLRDGNLVVISRKEGGLSWSTDNGRTWTAPVVLPFKMYDPWLLTLKDDTLICVHGSYHEKKHGLRAILSPDGGKTWMAAGPDYGFSVDPSVYGYSRGIQLPDGSVFITYLHTGGHTTEDARAESIFGLRFRVKKGCSGIELLPAPGSPAVGGKGPQAKPREAGKPRKEI